MSHNRDLSAAAAQLGFHSSNIGIGSEAPRYALDVYNSNLLVSGPSAGNIILEDRGVGDSSRPFHVVSSDGGKFVINRSNRNASGTTTSSVNSLTLSSSGNLGLGPQTNPTANIHIGDISNGYELKITANALQFNRSSSSYIDQVHDTGSILFRMGSSHTEAMRIDSSGRLLISGLAALTSTSLNHPVQITADGDAQNIVCYGRSSDDISAIDFYEADKTTNLGEIQYRRDHVNFRHRVGYISFATGGVSERLRIHSDGTLLVNSSIDNTSSHGRMIVHAPTSGDDGFKSIEIGNTNGENIDRGSTIVGQPKSNGHSPFTLIGSWDNGSTADVYYGGGWGSNQRPAMKHRFYTASSYPTTNSSGSLRMVLDGNGYLTVSNQPAFFVYRNQSAWTLAANDVFIFNTAELNVGSHYNTSNGRFTAPIAGRYVFHFFSIYTGNANSDSIEMYKNSTRMYGGDVHFTNSIGSSWDCVHYSRVIQLSAGDYVHMQTRTGHTFHGNHWGGWSGYLLG